MAGGDELSARLPVAERVSLPVRLKQRAIIPFLTSHSSEDPTDTDQRHTKNSLR